MAKKTAERKQGRVIVMCSKMFAIVVANLICASATCASAAENRPPPSPTVIGASEKVCQLTGERDWETGRLTAARTFSNFGLDATDLGYPVEHDGKLVLLFGDSWPSPHGGGAAGEIPPDDAVGVTTRRKAPDGNSGCLDLRIHDKDSLRRTFAPATIAGLRRVKQGFFNVPSGGVSVRGRLYAFFWTEHCSDPNPLQGEPGTPLARPPASQTCPENNDRNSIGRGILARSNNDGRTFGSVVPMPPGFVYSTAVNARVAPGLPDNQRLGVFILGVPRYRASIPYLARAPIDSFGNPKTWKFFAGRSERGAPLWVSYAEWVRGAGSSPGQGPLGWRPPDHSELFIPAAEAGRCVGEFSITWNWPLHEWLMFYNCRGSILARVAQAPWGPWSAPAAILGPGDHLGCRLLMMPEGCGNRRDFWPGRRRMGKLVRGGLYAPYVLNRYTSAAAGNRPGRSSTIYWLVSTWNPYEVVVMRTTLRSDSLPGAGARRVLSSGQRNRQ